MIRQRVDRRGMIHPLEPASELIACNMPAADIGVIKEGPVRKWIAAKKHWDTKYASHKRRVQKQRASDMARGYYSFGNGEVPPPSALAGRRKTGDDLKEEKPKRSMGMSLWALWGSKHDKATMDREIKADKEPETVVATPADGANARPLHDLENKQKPSYSRSRSRRRTVTDTNQTGEAGVDENTSAADLLTLRQTHGVQHANSATTYLSVPHSSTVAPIITAPGTPNPIVTINDSGRPSANGVAFPFSLRNGHNTNASMSTLTSAVGVPPTKDMRTAGATETGLDVSRPTSEHSIDTKMTISERVAAHPGELGVIRPKINPNISTRTVTSMAGITPAESVTGDSISHRLGVNWAEDGVVRPKINTNPSTLTIISAAGVPPVEDVRTVGAVDAGLENHDVNKVEVGRERVVENGEVVPANRPPLETFVTANDGLMTLGHSE